MRFWEDRQESERTAECSPARATNRAQVLESAPMRWMGSGHPVNVVRSDNLRKELERWVRKREEVRREVMVGQEGGRVEGEE